MDCELDRAACEAGSGPLEARSRTEPPLDLGREEAPGSPSGLEEGGVIVPLRSTCVTVFITSSCGTPLICATMDRARTKLPKSIRACVRGIESNTACLASLAVKVSSIRWQTLHIRTKPRTSRPDASLLRESKAS